VPSFEAAGEDRGQHPRLREIPGMVPALTALPAGCKFQDRCPAVAPRCRESEPDLTKMDDGRLIRCFYPVAPDAGKVEENGARTVS